MLAVTPDPVRVATEGALWGAICDQGLLAGTVIVSCPRRASATNTTTSRLPRSSAISAPVSKTTPVTRQGPPGDDAPWHVPGRSAVPRFLQASR